MEIPIWAIVLFIVFVIIVIYKNGGLTETLLSPANWAPSGADLVEIRGRMPMFGYKTK